jgi:hypothetical protein
MNWDETGMRISSSILSLQKNEAHIDLLDMLHQAKGSKEIPVHKFLLILLSEEQYVGRLYDLVNSVRKSGSKICYVCVSRPYKDVIADLKSGKMDTDFFFFIDVLSSHYGKPEPRRGCIFLDSPKDLGAIRSAIERAIEKNNCTVLLFDTLSNLLIYQESFPILKFAHSLTVEKGENVIKMFLIMKENPSLEKENKELISDLKMFADKTVDFS